MNERWRHIPDYEDLYMVSDMGRIMAFPRTTTVGGLMALRPDRKGYLRVVLCKQGRPQDYFVHRLVLRAFVGEGPPESPHCAHGNGVPHDNRLENLRYATAAENQADRFLHGTDSSGERNPRAVLKNEDISVIHEMRSGGATIQRIADHFSVAHTTIQRVCAGRSWKHVA